MVSISEQIYQKHHREFERWFTSIHPNHELTFDWEHVYDSGWYKEDMANSGWYKEDMANGAWIVWSALNAKGCGIDTVESLAKEVKLLNIAQLALSYRLDGILIPLADKLIDDCELGKLKLLIDTFPSCSTRMKLKGKLKGKLTLGERE
jgi:hypothetical protein